MERHKCPRRTAELFILQNPSRRKPPGFALRGVLQEPQFGIYFAASATPWGINTTKTIQEWLSSADVSVLVKEWLRENHGQTRQALARYVCEELDLKDAMGALRIGGTVKALSVLEARWHWRKHGAWPQRADQADGVAQRHPRLRAEPAVAPGEGNHAQEREGYPSEPGGVVGQLSMGRGRVW